MQRTLARLSQLILNLPQIPIRYVAVHQRSAKREIGEQLGVKHVASSWARLCKREVKVGRWTLKHAPFAAKLHSLLSGPAGAPDLLSVTASTHPWLRSSLSKYWQRK